MQIKAMRSLSLESVRELVRREVPDWDDEMKITARFKAFSGQRSDWEPQFLFWRELIIKIARHFGVIILSPSEVKNQWFSREGLTPLCIDRVLLEMHKAGELVCMVDLQYSNSTRLSQIFRRALNFAGNIRLSRQEDILRNNLVILETLEVKAANVIKELSESQWTSSCIITMRKFQGVCGASFEASAVLSYLSERGKAHYLSLKRDKLIEGVKLSLKPATVASITGVDYDMLQLVWTREKLELHLAMIKEQYEMSRGSALASLKGGHKKVALRHARELKAASGRLQKFTMLLNRVEEVIDAILDTESTSKVSEAIQSGARALKENTVDIEELHLCLRELADNVDLQKQLDDALAAGIEDEDLDEELQKLELEIKVENLVSAPDGVGSKEVSSQSADLLLDAISGLQLSESAAKDPRHQDSEVARRLSQSELEAAT